MALPELAYDKDWTKAEDFPTYEGDEAKVRSDLQYLFNQILTFINEVYSPAVMDEIAQSQTSGVASGSVRTQHFDPSYDGATPRSVAPHAAALYPAKSITVQDYDGSHSATTSNVDFSGNTVIRLPATIKAVMEGAVESATRLATARLLSVQDATAAHTGEAVSFDGSANASLRLPATIAAALIGNVVGNLTGNANTATKLGTARTFLVKNGDGNKGASASFDGSGNVELPLPATLNITLGTVKLNGNSYGNILPASGEDGQLFFLKKV